jgi:hypothetical protein
MRYSEIEPRGVFTAINGFAAIQADLARGVSVPGDEDITLL